MKNTLSNETISIIKNSVGLIAKNDIDISFKMYELLFVRHPEIRQLFSDAIPDYHINLAEILSIYAVNIDRIDRLMPALKEISHKHIKHNIQPRHYPLVGSSLIEAMEEILGEDATIELLDAWREAYKFLANILITIEQGVYKSQEL